MVFSKECLNPCFSGNRFGREDLLGRTVGNNGCLNPCFSGNRFGSEGRIDPFVSAIEGCLNPCFSGNRFGRGPRD